MEKSTNFPKDSCSASTRRSSMMKGTSTFSSSSYVSRNPPATSNPRIAEDEFQSYNMPTTTTHDQSVASHASINEGELLIHMRGWSMGRVVKLCNNDPSILDDIVPNDIVFVAVLKLGSLYLQKILKDYPLYFNKIFKATLNFTYLLMVDPEGAYVLGKLYELCDSNQLKLIVEKILSCPVQLKNAAKNYTGAETLIKLISVLKITNPLFHKFVLDSLTSEICVVDIMRSEPGSNLFKSCLKDLDPPQNKILYNRAATHCSDLATDASGYGFLIALIEHNAPYLYKKLLLWRIADDAVYLSQSPHGSYVIQATLLQHPEVDSKICAILAGKYLNLSVHKYANHVVQKCMLSSWKGHLILELIYSGKLHLLSKDPVGNYVVQTALTATKSECPDLYYGLVGQIQPYLEDLGKHPIGSYIVDKLRLGIL